MLSTDLTSNCAADRPPALSQSGGSLTLNPDFIGNWESTNPNTVGIKRATIREEGDRVLLRAFGVDGEGEIDWGEVELELLADAVDATIATKIRTLYDFGFMDVRIHGWVKLGVMVFAVFTRFKDNSDRANIFDREFFVPTLKS